MPRTHSGLKCLISLGINRPLSIFLCTSSIAFSLVIANGSTNSGRFCFEILLKTTFGLPQYTHVVDASVPLMMISPPHSLHVYT